jgi:ABC-type sulfate/molybdate transport systems ATPase subunit
MDGGEVVGLIGANGSGKTTLVRLVLGLARCASGAVEIQGENAGRWTVAERAARIGYANQNLGRMYFLLSALDEVSFSLARGDSSGAVREAQRERARSLLGQIGLTERAEDSPFVLSSREQMLLAMACLEGAGTPVVILDEPPLASYRRHQEAFGAFLGRCRRRGCAVLLVSHDLDLLEGVSDRLLILDGGRIAFDGPTERAWSSAAFARLGWAPPPGAAIDN